MRKRAAIDRRFPLRLDTLEERTLLSAIVAVPEAGSPRAVIVEPGPWFGNGVPPWKAPSFTIGASRPDPYEARAGLLSAWKALDDLPEAGAPAFESYAASYSAPIAKALPAAASPIKPMVGVWPGGGESTTLVIFNFGTAYGTSVSWHDMGANAPVEISVPPGPFAAFMASRSAQDNVEMPGPLHAGLSLNPAFWHAGPGFMLEDPSDSLRELINFEKDVYQPVLRADLSSTAVVTPQNDAGREAREGYGLPATAAAPAASNPAARGAAPGHAFVPELDFGRDSERPVIPLGDVPLATFGNVSTTVAQAVRGTGSAVGAVVAGRVEPRPAPAQAIVPQADADTDATPPEPQGLGLIAEVLPFDGNTVAAAIDRFFDRFEDPSAEQPDDYEPAALTPPPGVVLIAVAAAELTRRHLKRRREEEAAARPRRGNVEGFRFEESFGSSGPWSSRLS